MVTNIIFAGSVPIFYEGGAGTFAARVGESGGLSLAQIRTAIEPGLRAVHGIEGRPLACAREGE